jgi:hypothetical protein
MGRFAPHGEGVDEMVDIGVAFYRWQSPGCLQATHASRPGEEGVGTGIATGDPSEGYDGDYRITYVNPDGAVAGTWDLTIDRAGEVYLLSWRKEGRVTHHGVGIETPGGLSVGWRPCG